MDKQKDTGLALGYKLYNTESFPFYEKNLPIPTFQINLNYAFPAYIELWHNLRNFMKVSLDKPGCLALPEGPHSKTSISMPVC